VIQKVILMWFSSVPFGLYEQDVVSQGNPNREVLVCAIVVNGMDVQYPI